MTMLPRPRGSGRPPRGPARLHEKNTPRTLTAISRSYSAGSTSANGRRERDAGVGHDSAERALRVRRRDDLADLSDVGHVELDGTGRRSGGSQLFDTRRRGRRVDVRHDDVVAAGGEGMRDRAADPSRAAGDERGPGLLSGCRWHR